MSGGVECRRPSTSVATECISTRILPWNQHLGGILVRAGPCTCSDRQIEPGMPSRRCYAPARSPLGAGTPRTAFCYRPRYCPPAAEAHDMGLPRPPLVSATS